jgi:hypothetical protein
MTDTKIETLIAEARQMPRQPAWPFMQRLADALEQVTAERDATLSAIREALECIQPSVLMDPDHVGYDATTRDVMRARRILSRALDGQEAE